MRNTQIQIDELKAYLAHESAMSYYWKNLYEEAEALLFFWLTDARFDVPGSQNAIDFEIKVRDALGLDPTPGKIDW